MTLKISKTLALPLDFVTATEAILAKKGSGKTYTAQVLVEELLAADQQVVALDPTGAWWGLRADAGGNGPGYPIAVLGGDHGDVELEATAGEAIARAVVEERFSCVIDTSCFTVGEEQRFVAAFLATLYRLNRKAMHLVVDEADVFAPQRPFGEEAKTLGAMQNIVRRGRIRGVGCSLITQRPQVLNKDVLSQVDQLITLRMNHPKDLGAIETWIAVHGDPKLAAKMIASLPDLPIGDAWVWAPASGIFERVTIRRKRTFDSGRTPKAGEHLEPPKVLAPVDIARLGKAIAATVESMRKTDVGVLRAEIVRLQRELEVAKKAKEPRTITVMEVPREARIKIAELYQMVHVAPAPTTPAPPTQVRALPPAIAPTVTAPRRAKSAAEPSRFIRVPKIAGLPGSDMLQSGEEKTLAALLQYPSGLRGEQLTVLTGYARSTRDRILQQLVRRGLVEKHGNTTIATASGREAMPHAKPLPVGPALREHWRTRLPAGEWQVLEQLINFYPTKVPRDNVEGYARSTRDRLLQTLARRQLVVTRGGLVAAADTLF